MMLCIFIPTWATHGCKTNDMLRSSLVWQGDVFELRAAADCLRRLEALLHGAGTLLELFGGQRLVVAVAQPHGVQALTEILGDADEPLAVNDLGVAVHQDYVHRISLAGIGGRRRQLGRLRALHGEQRFAPAQTQIGRASVGKECRSRWSP